MMFLDTKFAFNPIGQGGFYTGRINVCSRRHNVFSFVYDCGSISDRGNLTSSIQKFKKEIFGRKLDVLFLSHLDDDHVNGVIELLNGISCDKIYLPYLSPLERLIICLSHSIRSDISNYDDYLDFIKDPVDYFTNKGIEFNDLIYVLGNSEKDPDSEDQKEIREIEELNLNDNLELIQDLPEEYKSNENTKIKFKKGNGKLILNQVWEFYIYNSKRNEIDISDFIDFLKSQHGTILDDFSRDNKRLSKEQLIHILDDREKLTATRVKFKEIFKSTNKTGLVVQHKPLNYKDSYLQKEKVLSQINHGFSFNFHPYYRHPKYLSANKNERNQNLWGVTLLTGDTSLNQINDSEYIKNHHKFINIFQVPHHGSETGWDNLFLTDLNYKGKTSAILNFGYGNKYGHPRPKVLQELMDDNFDICFCNQFEYFKYRIHLNY